MSEFMYDELDSMELADIIETEGLTAFISDFTTDTEDLIDLLQFD